MKVVTFNNRVTPSGLYKCNQAGDNSNEYVSLAEYQLAIDLINELGEKDVQNRLLLKRWNEIAPGASWVIDNAGNSDLADEIDKLILDTSEAIK